MRPFSNFFIQYDSTWETLKLSPILQLWHMKLSWRRNSAIIQKFLPFRKTFLTVSGAKTAIHDWKAKRNSESISKATRRTANFCGLEFEVWEADFPRYFPFFQTISKNLSKLADFLKIQNCCGNETRENSKLRATRKWKQKYIKLSKIYSISYCSKINLFSSSNLGCTLKFVFVLFSRQIFRSLRKVDAIFTENKTLWRHVSLSKTVNKTSLWRHKIETTTKQSEKFLFNREF